MKIYTASEIKSIEAEVMTQYGIASIDLMEKAALVLFEEIKTIADISSPIKVFAGSHNNGGDALAVSRMLSQAGYDVEIFLLNTNNRLSPECQINRDRLVETCPNAILHEIQQKLDLPNLTSNDVVIDGMFGIGLTSPVTSSYALLIKFINNSHATVISLDIPSGMFCEDNTETSKHQIIHADYTLSIHAIKPAFLLPDCQQYIGKCKILDIGLPTSPSVSLPSPTYTLNEEEDMAALLKPRDSFGNKGTFGHGLLIAGSYGMAGAAIISASAAMKSGLGKLTIHTPAANNSILQTSVPQAVIHNDKDNYSFTSFEDTEEYNALAIGPGLGKNRETSIAFFEQITHTTLPLVIDADGLNILAEHKGRLQQLPKESILTPHPKEFTRLFGVCDSDFSMLNKAREEAVNLQVYIILKNHYTAICSPDGQISFNTNGNSGMATAGTGDALTGIILSLLAQGYTPGNACKLGVFLHGLAGDIAAEKLSEEGMTVMDLVENIPYAIKKLKKIKYPYA